MPTLPGLAVVRLHWGPYAIGDTPLEQTWLTVEPSVELIDRTTGQTILDTPETYLGTGPGGSGTVELTATDDPGLRYSLFSYAAWLRTEGPQGPVAREFRFQLPAALPEVHLELLDRSTEGAYGLSLPVGVGPPGEPGTPGEPGKDGEDGRDGAASAYHVHYQTTPATVWEVEHGLARRAVNASVYSLDYAIEWEGFGVQPLDDLTCRLTFDDPTSGVATIT